MKTNNPNISKVSKVGKRAVEKDMGNIDIAVAAVSLAAGGMDSGADVAGRCDFLARAICVT